MYDPAHEQLMYEAWVEDKARRLEDVGIADPEEIAFILWAVAFLVRTETKAPGTTARLPAKGVIPRAQSTTHLPSEASG